MNYQFLEQKSHVKLEKGEIMASLIKTIPGAISNFSWGNKTIKHYMVEKKGNQMECSLGSYDLYFIYHLNTVRLQCRLSALS